MTGSASGSSMRRRISAGAHPHSARRVDDLGRHFADAGRDVADHDHQRERDHADDRVRAAEPDDRDQQREERERRDRVEQAAHAERPAKARARDARRRCRRRARSRRRSRARSRRSTRCCQSATATWSQLRRNHVIVRSRVVLTYAPASIHSATASKSGASERSSSRNAERARTPVVDARAPAPSVDATSGARRSTACAAITASIAIRWTKPLAHLVELRHAARGHRRVVLDALGNRQEIEARRIREVANLVGERRQRFLRGREPGLLRTVARELQRQPRRRRRQQSQAALDGERRDLRDARGPAPRAQSRGPGT